MTREFNNRGFRNCWCRHVQDSSLPHNNIRTVTSLMSLLVSLYSRVTVVSPLSAPVKQLERCVVPRHATLRSALLDRRGVGTVSISWVTRCYLIKDIGGIAASVGSAMPITRRKYARKSAIVTRR